MVMACASNEFFRELARALHWQPSRLVAMLWAYFDESGTHYPGSGNLEWLVLAGGMTTADDWDLLSIEWEKALDEFGIDIFHMKDFENYQGLFKDWDRKKHEMLLNRLLNIQATYVPQIFGITNHTGRYAGGFRKIYMKNILDVLTVSAHYITPTKEGPLSLMFAVHKEIKCSSIEKCFRDNVGRASRLRTVTTGDPADVPALQVADMIAYELSHSIRRDRQEERYPYKHMKEHARNLTLWCLL